MKRKVPSFIKSKISTLSQSWSGIHERARTFGKQSEFARRNSERIQAAALALEIGVATAGAGAVIGGTYGGPKGAAVGASVGFVAGVGCTLLVIDWDLDDNSFSFVPAD